MQNLPLNENLKMIAYYAVLTCLGAEFGTIYDAHNLLAIAVELRLLFNGCDE